MMSRVVRNYLYSPRRNQRHCFYDTRNLLSFNNMTVHNKKENLEELDDTDDKIDFITKMVLSSNDKYHIIQHVDINKNVLATIKCKKNLAKRKTEVVNVV